MAQVSGFFEIAVGILVFIIGGKIYLSPHLIVLGHQMEMSGYNKLLGILLGITGFLWVWLGLKKRVTGK